MSKDVMAKIASKDRAYFNLLIEIQNTKKKYPTLRSGQNIFNTVHDLYPKIANYYRSGAIDPFYKDHRIDLFLKAVRRDLDKMDKEVNNSKGNEMPAKTEKLLYFRNCLGGIELAIDVEEIIIPYIDRYFTFFHHIDRSDVYNRHLISEYKTGKVIGCGLTKEKAIENTVTSINSIGIKKFNENIEDVIEKYGIINSLKQGEECCAHKEKA